MEQKVCRVCICPLSTHAHSLPSYQHPLPKGPFARINEPVWTHQNHPKPSRSGSLLPITRGVHSVSADECTMTCIHYYSIIQSGFMALKTLPHLFMPPSPQSLATIGLCLHSCTFSGLSYGWSPIVCSLFTSAFHLVIDI